MKGIQFNDEMVRAVLEGRKTQTRRPIKWPIYSKSDGTKRRIFGPTDIGIINEVLKERQKYPLYIVCPYGQVGDRLWVREAFALESMVESGQEPPFSDGRPIQYWNDGVPCSRKDAEFWIQPHYRSTDPTPELCYEDSDGEPTVRWKPSIHMPRWASRITLKITGIRVERLREITEEDAIKEGARKFEDLPSRHPYGQDPRWSMETPPSTEHCLGSARHAFGSTWNSIYGKKGLWWETNCFVWVIGFKRV